MTPRAKREVYLALLKEQLRRRAETSLHTFLVHWAWGVLNPATPFTDNWHIHSMCEHLEAVTSGEIKRLVINLPFRMLKSTIVTQTFPAWEWITRPSLAYLTASYAKDIATRDAVDSRRIITSPEYQEAWVDVFKMTGDQNVKTRYENDKKGMRVVTATDAAGTGFGGNRIIIDDPVSAKDADSEVARASSIEWWRGTASTRLNDPTKDAIIIVHQRLHRDDLTGYILAEESGWEHLILPMRFDPDNVKTTSLGFRDPRTQRGELLAPKRLGETIVKEMETRLGGYHTAAQLQQNPTPRGGTIFKEFYWQFYGCKPQELVGDLDEIIWSWDLTFKASETSDYVAGLCIGRKGSKKYLLKQVLERLTFSETKTRMLMEAKRFDFATKTVAVLVEEKANGAAIIDALKDDIAGLTPITPQGGKVVRAHAIQPQHEARNFYLPDPTLQGNQWVYAFIDTFNGFPNVRHDDAVDAWTQGINWFATRENYAAPSAEPYITGASNLYELSDFFKG